jgi:hypothetical protein
MDEMIEKTDKNSQQKNSKIVAEKIEKLEEIEATATSLSNSSMDMEADDENSTFAPLKLPKNEKNEKNSKNFFSGKNQKNQFRKSLGDHSASYKDSLSPGANAYDLFEPLVHILNLNFQIAATFRTLLLPPW